MRLEDCYTETSVCMKPQLAQRQARLDLKLPAITSRYVHSEQNAKRQKVLGMHQDPGCLA